MEMAAFTLATEPRVTTADAPTDHEEAPAARVAVSDVSASAGPEEPPSEETAAEELIGTPEMSQGDAPQDE